MLPTETNTFVYDGSVWEHGADRGFPMHERCQIIISGILDIEKHHALLDKSIGSVKTISISSKPILDMLSGRILNDISKA